MARIRSDKPEAYQSETLAEISLAAERTFKGMATIADDRGRLADKPAQINGELWSMRGNHTKDDLDAELDEMAKVDLVCRYTGCDGKRYLHVLDWDEWQKIDRPSRSKLPRCPAHRPNAELCGLHEGACGATSKPPPPPRVVGVEAFTPSQAPVDPSHLYDQLIELADGEFLLEWHSGLPATDSSPVRQLVDDGLLFTYRAGRPRIWYAYLVGRHEAGDATGPGSALPPPSVQAGDVKVMYARRDQHICHLCWMPVSDDWRKPKEFHSLDHFIPRSKGGLDYPSNIRTAHTSCNKARRDRDVAEFRAWLAARGQQRAFAIAGRA